MKKVFTSEVIFEKIESIASEYGYQLTSIDTDGSETGGMMTFKGKRDIIIDIGDNQSYYRLSTYNIKFSEIIENNVATPKTLVGVEGYFKMFS